MEPTRPELYTERRKKALARFNQMRWGSRMRAAHALHTAPIMVSNVLNGAMTRPDILEKLENWLDLQDKATDTTPQKSKQK